MKLRKFFLRGTMARQLLIKFLIVFVFFGFISANTGELTKKKLGSFKKVSGFFDYYRDQQNDKIWLEVDKLNQEFIIAGSSGSGLGSNDVGLDRNSLGSTKVVKFIRAGGKLLLVQPNYKFRADSGNEFIKKTVKDAFAYSVIWSFKIYYQKSKSVIIDLTSFLLSDFKNISGTLKRRKQGTYILDKNKSSLYLPKIKNFPENSEFESMLTFTCKNPGKYVKSVSPDAGAVTLRQHLSLVKLPDDKYKMRRFNIRSGYMSLKYFDYSTPVSEPLIKRVIQRHRLKKKNPKARISEPVNPIIYYVDRGIPEDIQKAVIEGASWWNRAFTAIGYKDAFQVKILPEDADPMDIRYNMINWVHRSTRGWSYGGGVTDPRTGEIIKGNVSMGSLRIRQDYLIARGLIENFKSDNKPDPKILQMALQRIKQLSCHEIGHTLGLVHNYASNVNQRSSVMDYPHPLIKILNDTSLDLTEAYTNSVGEWDLVTIAYGYQDFPEEVNEDKALEKILNNAFKGGLVYLTDQDAYSKGSAHPLTHRWDNGKNPVEELKRVMKVRKIALENFGLNKIPKNSPLTVLEDIFVPVYLFHRYQIEAASKVVGGLYYNHRIKGDSQKSQKITSGKEQREAVKVLLETIRPENLIINKNILKMIPPRAPGYSRSKENFESYMEPVFDPLTAAENIAGLTVSLLLDANRAARLIHYHSLSSEYPGLAEIIEILLENTLQKNQIKDKYAADIQRVVNYTVVYSLMRLYKNEKSASQVKAVTLLKLNQLKDWLEAVRWIKDYGYKAHYFYILSQINLFLSNPEEFKIPVLKKIPQGSPI